MEASELNRQLLNHTIAHSGLEVKSYLDMSRINACPRILYTEMLQGRYWTMKLHLHCHLNRLFKKSVLHRLESINPDLLGPPDEFSDFGGRFMGYSDGSWDGDLLEIKPVADKQIPKNERVPNNHFRQAQTYMKYGGYTQAQVVYVARETGYLKVVPVSFNEKVAEMSYLKAASILEAVDSRLIPECECGWCDKVQ